MGEDLFFQLFSGIEPPRRRALLLRVALGNLVKPPGRLIMPGGALVERLRLLPLLVDKLSLMPNAKASFRLFSSFSSTGKYVPDEPGAPRWLDASEPADPFDVEGIDLRGVADLAHWTSRLGDYRQLRTLTLSDTDFSDADAPFISRLKRIERLYLTRTRIGDQAIASLVACERIENLGLAWTAVSDASAERLAQLSALKNLVLSGTQFTDAGLLPLARLQRLQTLWLDDNAISDAGLANLRQIGSLRRLHLNRTRLSEAAVGPLTTMTHLRWLHLMGLPLPPAALTELRAALPSTRIITAVYPQAY